MEPLREGAVRIKPSQHAPLGKEWSWAWRREMDARDCLSLEPLKSAKSDTNIREVKAQYKF